MTRNLSSAPIRAKRIIMSSPSTPEVTRLLVAWSNRDRAALDQLMPIVYAELRRLASRYLGAERTGHTLQTTALVHEAYLRLVDQSSFQWQNRAHFFALAARLMRHILVDYARARHNIKRGGRVVKVTLDGAAEVCAERAAEMVA